MSDGFLSELKKIRETSSSITIDAISQDASWIADVVKVITPLNFKEIKVKVLPSVFAIESAAKEFLPYSLTFICDVYDFSDSNVVLGILNLKRNSQKVVLHYKINEKNFNLLSKVKDFCVKIGIKSILFTVDMPLEDCFLQLKDFVSDAVSLGFSVNFNNYLRETSILLNDYIDMQAGPIVVQFEVTNKCNHKCVFCYHHSNLLLSGNDVYFRKHKKDEALIKRSKDWHSAKIDFEFFKGYAKELRNSGCKYIQLGGGGEPFTHPEIYQMIKLLKKYGFTVQVFTNFSLIDKNKIKEIAEIGLDVAEVNLSAANASTYAKIHDVSPKVFSDVIENLMYLKKIKEKRGITVPSIRIMNPICSLNYEEIPLMVELAHSVGADAVYLGHLQTTALTDFLLLSNKQVPIVNELVLSAKARCEELSLKNNFDYYLSVLNSKGTLSGSHTREIYDRVGCLMSFYETQIHLDGKIAPCCLHPTIFDIKGRSFNSVWNSVEYKRYRKKVLGLYTVADKPLLCRGCRMCVYQEDIQRFYGELGGNASFL